jgi:hypothetical protein
LPDDQVGELGIDRYQGILQFDQYDIELRLAVRILDWVNPQLLPGHEQLFQTSGICQVGRMHLVLKLDLNHEPVLALPEFRRKEFTESDASGE